MLAGKEPIPLLLNELIGNCFKRSLIWSVSVGGTHVTQALLGPPDFLRGHDPDTKITENPWPGKALEHELDVTLTLFFTKPLYFFFSYLKKKTSQIN